MSYFKYLCILALAGLSALGLMAPAASAEATLCTNDTKHQGEALCAGLHGKHVKVGTELFANLVAGTSAVLTVTNNSGGTVRIVECAKSTAKGKVSGTEGTGTIESLTFAECTSSGCTNVSAKTPAAGKSNLWASTVTRNAVETNGILHSSLVSGTFTATCLFITATCEYEASTATSEITGGEPARLHANNVPLSRIAGAESICGTKADWKASYSMTTPSSLYIT